MRDRGVVQGSKECAKELVIGKDTVYVHSDIKSIETEDGAGLYQYHEIQYTKDEYIHLLAEKNALLESRLESTQEAVDFLLLGNG